MKPISDRKSSIRSLMTFVQNGQLPAGIIPLQKDFREVIVLNFFILLWLGGVYSCHHQSSKRPYPHRIRVLGGFASTNRQRFWWDCEQPLFVLAGLFK